MKKATAKSQQAPSGFRRCPPPPFTIFWRSSRRCQHPFSILKPLCEDTKIQLSNMARFTSIGMPKKSFVASGAEESHQPAQAQSESGPSTAKPDQPPAKKRKRRGTRGKVVPEGGEAAPQSAETKGWSRDHSVASEVFAPVDSVRLTLERAKLSAQHAFERRENRQNDRTSATTCFACRSVGHPARECPNVLLALEQGEGSAALLDEGGDKEQLEKEKKGMKRKPGKKGGDIVGGKCYR